MAPQKDTRSAGVDGWKFKVWCIVLIHTVLCIDHCCSKGS
jgi:hypothetical protein